MSDVQTLLVRCQALGAEFFPLPDGKLKVRAPAPLPEDLQAELRQRKAEVLTLLSQQSSPLFLRCRQCHGRAEPDTGTLTGDGQNFIQFWKCLSCHARGSSVYRLQ